MSKNFSKNVNVENNKFLSRDNSINNIRTRQKKEKIILKDVFLYSWGKNTYGELGIGTSLDVNIPTPITSLTTKNIIEVKPGGRNTLLIKGDGNIYLCGSNIFGLLAHNSNTQNNALNQKIFKIIKYFEEKQRKIKSISIAEFHCLALTTEGGILGWGGNLFNKLGQKSKFIAGLPTEIKIKTKIKSISCGDYHSCALSQDGALYTWGGGGDSYNRGQCGHGNLKDIENPKKVEYFIKNNIKIKNVSCGGYHTIVISETGEELFSFGKGIFGQLGHGKAEDSSTPQKVIFKQKQNLKYENNEKIIIIDVKCGGEHSLFLSSNNYLYACGHGYLGQLGLGNDKNINSPLIVLSLMNKKIIEIAAGWSHSLVLTSEGNIYSTGCNKYGELGIGKKNNKYNYIWISKLSKLNIKHISAGGHHSWCLLDNSEPYTKNKSIPEPLLKSNFSMKKKSERNSSNLSEEQIENLNSEDSISRWDRKSNLHNKSAISVDNTNKRRYRYYDEEDDDINNSFIDKNNKRKPNKKIKKIIDDYNNENNMSVDDLIDGIDKINKNLDNSDSEKNDNKDKNEEEEKENEEENNKSNYSDCKLKIIYTNLNLSHRFIRFQSSFDYEQLKTTIINNFIIPDKGIISYQFQRDEEVEKNTDTLVDLSKAYKTYLINYLLKLGDLSKTYTLGMVYDYDKNKDNIKFKELSNNNKHVENKQPFYGYKIVNSDEIINNKNSAENQLSQWIIDFNNVFNMILLGEKNKTLKSSILLFMELRPNIFNTSNIEKN